MNSSHLTTCNSVILIVCVSKEHILVAWTTSHKRPSSATFTYLNILHSFHPMMRHSEMCTNCRALDYIIHYTWSDPLDLAELHSFRLVYFKHKEIVLVVCIVSRWHCRRVMLFGMPVHRYDLIWSPSPTTQLANRV